MLDRIGNAPLLPGTAATGEGRDTPRHRPGLSFEEVLAASGSEGRVQVKNGRDAARAAELLQLEMMRDALTLDGAANSSNPRGGGMREVLAAYGQAAGIAEPASPSASGGEADRTGAVAGPGSGGDPSMVALVRKASQRYGVDEGLISAVIRAESNFSPTALSPAGAQGLMQLMPATAAGLGVTDPFDPEQNVMAGTRFLRDLLKRYGGDLDKTLAAYNWGPGNVDRGTRPLPAETRTYLVKVKRLYADYRAV